MYMYMYLTERVHVYMHVHVSHIEGTCVDACDHSLGYCMFCHIIVYTNDSGFLFDFFFKGNRESQYFSIMQDQYLLQNYKFPSARHTCVA